MERSLGRREPVVISMRSFEIPTRITYPEVNKLYNFAMIDRHVSASGEVLECISVSSRPFPDTDLRGQSSLRCIGA
jgi:hypothetical protein